MKYYLTFSRTSYINLIFGVIYILILLKYFWIGQRHEAINYFIATCFVGYLVFFVLPRLAKVLYFCILKRPILETNDVFIFDHYKNIKYYWNDIEKINTTNSRITLTLREPHKYFREIANPFSRLRTRVLCDLYNETALFKIDISILEFNEKENTRFLQTLDELNIAGKN